jgi:ribosome-associated heat shock protein Hsp15
MKSDTPPRIDKYLWSIRQYKTRSIATEACRSGKVKIDDQAVKPSREVKVDEIITINLGQITKTILVKALLERRVGAKIAVDYYDDLTPQEEYDKAKMQRETNYEYRDKGLGRPTKKERRIIERLKKHKHF